MPQVLYGEKLGCGKRQRRLMYLLGFNNCLVYIDCWRPGKRVWAFDGGPIRITIVRFI